MGKIHGDGEIYFTVLSLVRTTHICSCKEHTQKKMEIFFKLNNSNTANAQKDSNNQEIKNYTSQTLTLI